MTLPTRDELRALHENATPPCVSLYMPTHRGGYDSQQDPIRFKNLLRRAEEQLMAAAVSAAECEEILAGARPLVDDGSFWQNPQEPGEGLAIFLSRGRARRLRLPHRVREMVVAGERFHLGPLLAMADEDQRFHLLCLSQKDVRLFEGNRTGLREVPLKGVPRSVQAALHYDDNEHSPQYHAGSGAPQTNASRGRAAVAEAVTTGARQGQFHGHGVVDEDAKAQVQRFLEVLADALVKPLRQNERPLPLVLAGVEYETAMFRAISRHPRIVETGIDGNPEGLSEKELCERAWPLVAPVLGERARKAAAQYEQLAGTARVSTDLTEILLAAIDGRVDSLFFDPRASQWGQLDAASRTVDLHPVQHDGDEDLVERAASETFFHGGCVYEARHGETPGGGEMAAVFRY